ncbi:unnamed protein product [Prorocentrum cordatum]|uniref:Uncharacterized protein n=1 Tax=Prorocentrum cordatum TaxID=2364126 RepID=A0ABN9Q1U6_9DINO|nr:unnamed protein product [Polarella glacialis]
MLGSRRPSWISRAGTRCCSFRRGTGFLALLRAGDPRDCGDVLEALRQIYNFKLAMKGRIGDLIDFVNGLPNRTVPIIMIDANGHVGIPQGHDRPIADDIHIGAEEPERENVNDDFLRQFCWHAALSAVNTFMPTGPTFYSNGGGRTSQVRVVLFELLRILMDPNHIKYSGRLFLSKVQTDASASIGTNAKKVQSASEDTEARELAALGVKLGLKSCKGNRTLLGATFRCFKMPVTSTMYLAMKTITDNFEPDVKGKKGHGIIPDGRRFSGALMAIVPSLTDEPRSVAEEFLKTYPPDSKALNHVVKCCLLERMHNTDFKRLYLHLCPSLINLELIFCAALEKDQCVERSYGKASARACGRCVRSDRPSGNLGIQDLLETMRGGNFFSKLTAWEKRRLGAALDADARGGALGRRAAGPGRNAAEMGRALKQALLGPKELEKFRRLVACIRRHGGAEQGIQRGKDGWFDCEDIFRLTPNRRWTCDGPKAAAQIDNKGRIELMEFDGCSRIRACQGHPFAASGEGCEQATSWAGGAIHGAFDDCRGAIAQRGIRPMGRGHVRMGDFRRQKRSIVELCLEPPGPMGQGFGRGQFNRYLSAWRRSPHRFK